MTQVLIDRATLEQLVMALESLSFAKLIDGTYADKDCKLTLAITAGRAALAGAEPAGWQTIETKPPVMEPVLMWDWKQVFIEQWWGPEFHLDKRITHWMPLPTPPKD